MSIIIDYIYIVIALISASIFWIFIQLKTNIASIITETTHYYNIIFMLS